MAIRNDIDWSVMKHSGKKAYPKCRGCAYVSDEGYCIYILKTGHRRPCKPGEKGGCQAKKKAGEGVTNSVPPPLLPGSAALKKARAEQKPIDHERALALYKKGSSDANIASSLGATRMGVLKWRKRHGLPSNFKRGRCKDV